MVAVGETADHRLRDSLSVELYVCERDDIICGPVIEEHGKVVGKTRRKIRERFYVVALPSAIPDERGGDK